MKFEDYFEPLDFSAETSGSLGEFMHPCETSADLSGMKLALFFVPESRYSNADPLKYSADILNALAGLYPHGFDPKIAVLGSLKLGESIVDTEAAITDIVFALHVQRVVPCIIGGDRELTYSIYKAFEKLEQVVNITTIDSLLNIENDGYIGRIIKEQPNYLFNYSNIGFQTYLVSPTELLLADELYFDVYRLGQMRGSIDLAEPIIRSSDILSVSMSSLKSSEMASTSHAQPNGFYAEEICQTLRYAGLSEKLTVLFLSDLSGAVDQRDAMLVGQMIWCLLDGLNTRRSEIPSPQNDSFLKYRISLKNDEFNLVFYKSLNTDRWWMEVPVPPEYANKYRRHHLIPCDYHDYLQAANDDLPERWWRAYKKML